MAQKTALGSAVITVPPYAFSAKAAATFATVFPTATVEMAFAGPGMWVDVTADVLGDGRRLSLSYGIRGNTVFDRVAPPGKASFSLNNSASNSAGLAGYYSPDHVNARPGFDENIDVRISFTYGGTPYRKFKGKASQIKPLAGSFGERTTQVEAVDYIAQVEEYERPGFLTLQENITSDSIYNAILNAVDIPPTARSISTGVSTFDYGLDSAVRDRQTALNEIYKLASSGWEYVFVKGDTAEGEVFTVQTRHDRLKTVAISAHIYKDLQGLDVTRSRGDVYDRVVATYYPRDVATAEEVIYTHNEKPSIMAGKSISVDVEYRDSSNTRRIGAYEVDTSPTADTDFKFGSSEGSANDLNADLGITITPGGAAARVTFTNNGTSTGFVNLYILRGKPVRFFESSDVENLPVGSHGNRTLKMDLPYITQFNDARDFADTAASRYGSPFTNVQNISFRANRNADMMKAALSVEPGSRVRIREDQTGIDRDFFVNGVDLTYDGKFLDCTWIPERAFAGDFWFLGLAGFSEIGISTTLGF